MRRTWRGRPVSPVLKLATGELAPRLKMSEGARRFQSRRGLQAGTPAIPEDHFTLLRARLGLLRAPESAASQPAHAQPICARIPPVLSR